MKKNKIKKILNKKGKIPICCLTAYSKNMAAILDKYCDITLVGDSLSMVLYGMKSTREITLDTMILHAKSVKKVSKKSLVVFDMPYKTYTNKSLAYRNALKVIKSTKCDAVKLEGGREISNTVKHLTKKGIPVLGHVGLLPQKSKKYKVHGRTLSQQKKIINDAKELTNSGVFAIVIECVLEDLAKKITKTIPIPTIGIGASKYCDGQILVTDDIIGMSNYYPKFVKKYSLISKIIEKSVKNYCRDVKLKKFPSNQHVYKN